MEKLIPKRALICQVMIASLLAPILATAAPPNWVDQRQLGPFVLQATYDLTPHDSLFVELQKLELELRRVLALRPIKRSISLVLLADEKEYRDVIAQRYPDAPHRRALFVKENGQSTVYVYRHEEMAIDLRHECTHALLHSDLDFLPLWLDEGLAEYFEMPAEERAFGHPHMASLRWRLRLGRVASVASLEKNREFSDLDLAEYRASWSWVHFMLHGPRPASEALWEYMADIRRGESPGQLSKRLELKVPNAQQQFADHFRHWERLALKQQRR